MQTGSGLLLNEATSRPVQPAPAEGLVLWDTDCGLSWVPIEKSDRSGTYCAELRRHHALMEQVCRVLRRNREIQKQDRDLRKKADSSVNLFLRKRSSWAAPPPRGHPPVAMILYYLYKENCSEGRIRDDW